MDRQCTADKVNGPLGVVRLVARLEIRSPPHRGRHCRNQLARYWRGARRRSLLALDIGRQVRFPGSNCSTISTRMSSLCRTLERHRLSDPHMNPTNDVGNANQVFVLAWPADMRATWTPHDPANRRGKRRPLLKDRAGACERRDRSELNAPGLGENWRAEIVAANLSGRCRQTPSFLIFDQFRRLPCHQPAPIHALFDVLMITGPDWELRPYAHD